MNLTTRKLIEKRFGRVKIYSDGFRVSLARHSGRSGKVQPVVQEKPWGAEVWIVYTSKYALKHIIVEAGKRLSLQKHTKKTETNYIISGRPVITLGNKKITLKPGDVLHVKAGTTHRIFASHGPIEIVEVSSPELSDVMRLADDYGR